MLLNNSVTCIGGFRVTPAGLIQWSRLADNLSESGFTSSGSKGPQFGATMVWAK
jgi:hypothetical protein